MVEDLATPKVGEGNLTIALASDDEQRLSVDIFAD